MPDFKQKVKSGAVIRTRLTGALKRISLTPREQSAAILLAALFLLGIVIRFIRAWR